MKQRSLRSSLLHSLIALVSFSAIALGQPSSGSIRGTVKDTQGSVIFGAKITLTDVAQGDNREAKTNQEGIFFFNPLKPSV